MDAATRIIFDIYDTFIKLLSGILGKSYISVKVQFMPQKEPSDPGVNKRLSVTIINASGPDIEIKEAWFLTSFNRRIFSEILNSRIPVRIRSKDREIYFLTAEELKAQLNEKVGETITQTVLYDKAQNKFSGRVDKQVEAEFAR